MVNIDSTLGAQRERPGPSATIWPRPIPGLPPSGDRGVDKRLEEPMLSGLGGGMIHLR